MQPTNRGAHYQYGRPVQRRQRKNPWPQRILIILIALLLLAGIFFLVRALFFAPGSDADGDAASTASNASSEEPSSTAPTPTPTPEPTPTPTPEPTPGPIWDDGSDGYLSEGIYIWNNKAFELFYGGNDGAQAYADAISSYKAYLPDQNVYNMLVPNHSEFGLPERIRDAQGCSSQRETTATVYNGYTADIIPVDIYDILNLHKDEYIYFNTDTHWSPLGAYYAYYQFCETAGVEAVPLDSMTKTTIEDYTGYLYTVTGESCLAENPDSIDVYDVPGEFTVMLSTDGETFQEMDSINSPYTESGYSVFVWGDNPCMQITNAAVDTGRKLLFVKDSYGNAMAPFLAASFDEVHVIDFRSFPWNLPDYCAEHGITDVLFFNSEMTAHTSFQIDSMNAMFQ